MMMGTHVCDKRCNAHDGEHVSIVYPGVPGRPSRETPHHLIGQSLVWENVRAQILGVDIALDAPACLWGPIAPAYVVRWKPLGAPTEATM